MILHDENVQQVFLFAKTINNIILNILLILFYNEIQTLKWKCMLNLTSDKTSETLFHL